MLILVPKSYGNSDALLSALEAYPSATDVFYTSEKREREGVALFLDSSSIGKVARYKVGLKVATNRMRIKFYDSREVAPALPLETLLDRVRRHRKRLEVGCTSREIVFLPEATSRDTWASLVDLRSDFSGYFRRDSVSVKVRSLYEAQPFEYDALSLPLKMAGIGEVTLSTAVSSSSIFDRIVFDNMSEDQMIVHDYGILSNPRSWAAGFREGSITDQQTGNNVRLWYANRANLEHILGVDLILYHEFHHSFLLIQYKKMREESEEQVYRLDTQLDAELERMNKVMSDIVAHDNTRLNSNPFFLRFCWQKQDTSCNSRVELLKGMNLPLGYFEHIRGTSQLRSDRGAEVLRADNVGKYLDNSQLIDLFHAGWIGSGGVTSEQLANYSRDRLAARHSVIVAKVPKPERQHGRS